MKSRRGSCLFERARSVLRACASLTLLLGSCRQVPLEQAGDSNGEGRYDDADRDRVLGTLTDADAGYTERCDALVRARCEAIERCCAEPALRYSSVHACIADSNCRQLFSSGAPVHVARLAEVEVELYRLATLECEVPYDLRGPAPASRWAQPCGDSCAANEVCAYAYNGEHTRCLVPKERGERCLTVRDCVEGLVCRRHGDAGVARCELPLQLGDPCLSSSAACAAGLECLVPDLGPKGDPRCTRKPPGTSGAVCRGSSACERGLHCLPQPRDTTAPWLCGPLLAEGEACSQPAHCQSSHCDPVSRVCKPCASNLECDASFAEIGLSGLMCIAGRCEPPSVVRGVLEAGQWCTLDANCSSGWCQDGTCVARSDSGYYCSRTSAR